VAHIFPFGFVAQFGGESQREGRDGRKARAHPFLLPSVSFSNRSPSDLSHQLSLSSPSLTITTPTLLPTLLQAYSLFENPLKDEEIKRRVVLTSSSTSSSVEEGFQTLEEFTKSFEDSELVPGEVKVDCGETSVICFSSGTEGLSKGVE